MATAKVSINGTVILDITGTTATAADVASAKKFFAADGTETTGAAAGGMNAQAAQSTSRATSSTYTSVISLTCSVAGTYDVYWSTTRTSTSGTWGSQLYIGGTAYGSAQTGSWSNHVQNIHLTGVTIAKNQTVAVYARSRGNSYYAYVPLLTIIQTA